MNLKRISPRDWLAEETGILLLKLASILDEAADFAPVEIGGDIVAGALDCLRLAHLSDKCATDGQLSDFHQSCERVLSRQFELQEAAKPYLVFDFDDWRGSPVSAREGCDWAAPMIEHRQILGDVSLLIEEIDNRLFALLSLAPEEKIRELEKTREELEAARARVSSARRNERQSKKARQ